MSTSAAGIVNGVRAKTFEPVALFGSLPTADAAFDHGVRAAHEWRAARHDISDAQTARFAAYRFRERLQKFRGAETAPLVTRFLEGFDSIGHVRTAPADPDSDAALDAAAYEFYRRRTGLIEMLLTALGLVAALIGVGLLIRWGLA